MFLVIFMILFLELVRVGEEDEGEFLNRGVNFVFGVLLGSGEDVF